MPNDVPPIDAEPPGRKGADRLQEIELRSLDASAKAKENINREADQRHSLRWLATIVVVLVIIAMLFVLRHAAHTIFTPAYFAAPSAWVIAAFVAPITSITAGSIALLIAAFRGFKEGDEKTASDVASRAAKSGGDMIN